MDKTANSQLALFFCMQLKIKFPNIFNTTLNRKRRTSKLLRVFHISCPITTTTIVRLYSLIYITTAIEAISTTTVSKMILMIVFSIKNIINLQLVKLTSTMRQCMHLRKKAQRMISQIIKRANLQKDYLTISFLILKILSVQIPRQC